MWESSKDGQNTVGIWLKRKQVEFIVSNKKENTLAHHIAHYRIISSFMDALRLNNQYWHYELWINFRERANGACSLNICLWCRLLWYPTGALATESYALMLRKGVLFTAYCNDLKHSAERKEQDKVHDWGYTWLWVWYCAPPQLADHCDAWAGVHVYGQGIPLWYSCSLTQSLKLPISYYNWSWLQCLDFCSYPQFRKLNPYC